VDQVWNSSPDNVQVENYYFDHTPLSTISGVVTENGVLTSTAIEGWLAALHLHPSLHMQHSQ
jgi:methylthioribose-1-phosphate isomerase